MTSLQSISSRCPTDDFCMANRAVSSRSSNLFYQSMMKISCHCSYLLFFEISLYLRLKPHVLGENAFSLFFSFITGYSLTADSIFTLRGVMLCSLLPLPTPSPAILYPTSNVMPWFNFPQRCLSMHSSLKWSGKH